MPTASAFKITLNKDLSHLAEALESTNSGIEVTENLDGSVGLGLTKSMEETLKIRPAGGGLVSYKARPFQVVLSMLISILWTADIPIRLIFLKSRQLGLSTFLQGVMHDLTRRISGISARTIAHRAPEAIKMHRMQERFYFHCPPQFRKELKEGKVFRDRLMYTLPHDSDIAVSTAGGKSIGRSLTGQLDHWTEVAFWPDAADTYNDLRQSIHDLPRTALFIESTANGRNFFHKIWNDAFKVQVAGKPNLWIPIFISWLEDPEAWMEFASDYQKEAFVGSYSDEERSYSEKWSLEPERMQWVRATIYDKCAGSWNKFNQEYPIDPSVAFLFTGWPWFSLSVVGDMMTNIQPPAFRGDILWLISFAGVKQIAQQFFCLAFSSSTSPTVVLYLRAAS